LRATKPSFRHISRLENRALVELASIAHVAAPEAERFVLRFYIAHFADYIFQSSERVMRLHVVRKNVWLKTNPLIPNYSATS
jgi:hypothetical protein